jgi:UDP-glucose 4-epimerase
VVVGGGLLGRHVATACTEAGRPVVLLARRAPEPAVRGARLVRGDAGDLGALAEVLAEGAHVVWCAGALLPAAPSDADAGIDLGPLESALGLLADRGGAITFFSSGGTVYGDPGAVPVTEDQPLRPQSVYAASKVAAEERLAGARARGVRAVVLRCGNVYGPYQRPGRSQGIVATALHCAQHRQPLTVFGDGSTVRDYVFVGDVASVVAKTIDDLEFPGTVNVGTGTGTRLDELVALIREVSGVDLVEDVHSTRGHDVKQVVLDTARLRAAMPEYRPRTLREGLTITWESLASAQPVSS